MYRQITSLAIKLHPGTPSRWPDWLRSTINALSDMGVPREHLLDFLSIVAEEMESADLLPPSKFVSNLICGFFSRASPHIVFLHFPHRIQMQTTLASAVPMVVQAISDCIKLPAMERSPQELNSALKCLQAWMTVLPAKYAVLPSVL